MKTNSELIKYLATSDLAVFFEIDRIALNDNHAQKENLLKYMKSIKKSDLELFLSNKKYKEFGKQIDSLSWEDNARISYCKTMLPKEIGKFRLQTLLDNNLDPPLPYNYPVFKDVKIDSNNLISLSVLQSMAKTQMLGNNIFHILLTLPQPNSMYWCARYLFEMGNFCDVRLRLDPLLIFNRDQYHQMQYKMFVYGKPPETNSYGSLKEIKHIRWMSDNYDSSDEKFTDAVWKPKDDEVHIIFEEIPKPGSNYYRGSRYFHSIFNCSKNKIIHFDGAIRIYSDDEIICRINCHVKDIGKIGKRVKVFQVDSEVDINIWSNIAASFFVWNEDVRNYFCN